MSGVNLVDHYKAVRSRMGMAHGLPIVDMQRPVKVAPVAEPVAVAPEPRRQRHLWEGRKLSAAQIQFTVAEYFDVSRDDIMRQTHKPEYIVPRHVAIYLCRKLTALSLTQIGVQFRRHHSTVLHATRVVDRMMDAREDMAGSVSEIEFQLTGKWPPTYFGA